MYSRRPMSATHRTAWLAVSLWAGACSPGAIDMGAGDEEGEEVCAAGENVAPDAPEVTNPIAGRMDVLGDVLTIKASDFVDPDGGTHVATEVEIWLMAGDEPAVRVWSAEVADAARLTRVKLA